MEPFLTLVIAVGGIATGIGAIWTALVARRQLNEQRQWLREQTEIARRQTQLTEQSLAQTERSLADQVQSLSEQNERARINLEVNLMYRLQERWDSLPFQNYRRRSLTYVQENYFRDGDILDVQYMDVATMALFEFFEDIGYLTKTGVLQIERVRSEHGGILFAWPLWEPAVKKLREEQEDPHIFEDLEHLYYQMFDYDRQRGARAAPPTKEKLRRFVETGLRAHAIAAGNEDSTKG
jgi:hypothetical protein